MATQAPSQEIKYETPADHVRMITMNRPETLNSLTQDGNAAMLNYVREFRDDDDAWVLILTGAGERSFSTGLDLRAQAGRDAQAGDPPPPPQIPNEGLHSYPSIEVFKPVIAAINGYAFGGGSEMALWADIRIMSENAEMGLLEPRRGLLSISGTTRMSRAIPIGLAMELIITGRRYKSADCYRMGLVSQVVPLADLISTATDMAKEIVLECSPMATRIAKEHVMRTLHLPTREALQFQSMMSNRLRQLSPHDTAEGPRAFTEKRKPTWEGR
jgi:enoyl-CoA hydratase/carnithine racemase